VLLRDLRTDLEALTTMTKRVARITVPAGSTPVPSPPEAVQGEIDELARKINLATGRILLLEGDRDKLREELDSHSTAAGTTPSSPLAGTSPLPGPLEVLTTRVDAMASQVADLAQSTQNSAAPAAPVPSSPAIPASVQATLDDLTTKVGMLGPQMTGLLANQDQAAFGVAERAKLGLVYTTNTVHDVLLKDLNAKFEALQKASEGTAQELQAEVTLRQQQTQQHTETVAALTAQVEGLQVELAQLQLGQTKNSGELGPLNLWAEQFKNFFRGWESNQIHDGNFLWEQIRLLKDDVHPGWRQLVSYDEPHPSGARLILNKRPFLEQPVAHAANSIRNYGSSV
jgi:polyhydroxyalkanoate synthesis regulator phasin